MFLLASLSLRSRQVPLNANSLPQKKNKVHKSEKTNKEKNILRSIYIDMTEKKSTSIDELKTFNSIREFNTMC